MFDRLPEMDKKQRLFKLGITTTQDEVDAQQSDSGLYQVTGRDRNRTVRAMSGILDSPLSIIRTPFQWRSYGDRVRPQISGK